MHAARLPPSESSCLEYARSMFDVTTAGPGFSHERVTFQPLFGPIINALFRYHGHHV